MCRWKKWHGLRAGGTKLGGSDAGGLPLGVAVVHYSLLVAPCLLLACALIAAAGDGGGGRLGPESRAALQEKLEAIEARLHKWVRRGSEALWGCL